MGRQREARLSAASESSPVAHRGKRCSERGEAGPIESSNVERVGHYVGSIAGVTETEGLFGRSWRREPQLVFLGMNRTLPPGGRRHEDRSGGNSVLPPSAALAAAIDEGEREGRAVFHAADIYVPRLTQVAVSHPRGGYALGQSARDQINAGGRSFLVREVAVYLDAPSAESASLLVAKPRAAGLLRHLAAAALRDIHGWPLTLKVGGVHDEPGRMSIGDHLGYGLRYHDGLRWRAPRTEEEDRQAASVDSRAARSAVAKGRSLWMQLAAWPWWPLAAGGHMPSPGLPKDWWEIPDVVANWWAWRDPDAFHADQVASRNRARERDLPPSS